ncbi:MAG: ABC transporter permease subunit [Thiopseudomonas sp.]
MRAALYDKRYHLSLLLALLVLCLWLPRPWLSADILQPPSLAHPFGTDMLGRDVLLNVLKSLPNTLLIALAAGVLPVAFALLLNALAYALGNLCRSLLLKLTDIMLILPSTLLLIVLAAFIQPSLWGSIVLVSALAWPGDFRIIGSALQKALQKDSLLLARSYGAGKAYLLRRHIVPAISPMLYALILQNGRRAISATAGLAFLGLLDPRIANLGSLLLDSQNQLHSAAFWWLLLPPMLALALVLMFMTSLQSRQVRHVL